MQTGRKRWRIHVLVLLAYALLALALTWPLALNLGSHVPGNGIDDPPLTWNLWWVRYALLDQGANPFDGSHLFYPLGINLAFYTLTVLNGLLSIPLQAVLGLIPASNILLLSSFVLSGYGAFLLAKYVLGTCGQSARGQGAGGQGAGGLGARWQILLAAFGGGLLYAFASSKSAYAALGQWNIASSQWIPFYVLYLLKMGDEPARWRYPLLAALFLLFQAYAEITYATFLILFTALWALWQAVVFLRGRQSQKALRLAANLVLVALLFGLGLAPMLAMMLPDMLAEGDIMVEGGGFADVFSADLVGFLVPSEYHPLFGSLVEEFSFDYGVGQHLYLGYAVLALVVVGIVAWRRGASCQDRGSGSQRAGFWAASALVFWLLTLGPSLRINGQDSGLPLPFALVAQLPFFEGNRYPSRYSVMLFMCLAVLVAMGLAALLRRAKGKRWLLPVSLGLVILVLFEHLSAPLPLTDMAVPPVYQAVAEEAPREATLLDLPVAWRNGFRVTGTEHPIIMFSQYYQSAHGMPILAGNTSRNPPLKFQYFTEAPVINTLIALETGHQVNASASAADVAIVEADRALAADVLRFFNIQAIVVHPAQTGPDMVPYLEETMPVEQFYDDGQQIAYRVNLPPWPAGWRIEPGDELARLSYAEGWGVPAGSIIWAQRRAARLLVPLDGREQQMALRAYAPGPGQELRVEVNGEEAGRLDLAPGWGDYEISLPAEVVQEGLNEVWLHFETLHGADLQGPSPRSIGQTGVEAPANVVVQSAGQQVGDFGNIYVNGENVSANERGYNVAVLQPQTGAVEEVAAFDTHDDEGASRALADFLADVPQGRIVAVAAADEASRLLGAEAVEALQGIGATGDLRERFRWGHAILGVQGALPGSALEALDWKRPVTVVAGEGATEPELAVALGPIVFSSAGE